jgi:peptidoglycan glycosyltransferase
MKTMQARNAGLLFLVCLFAVQAEAASELQTSLNELMQKRRGNVLVADLRTGRLLAAWNSRQAFELAYPPGSTIKLFTAAAALEEGLISPSEEVFCRRVPELLGEPFHCSHPLPGGAYTLSTALANSCNYFFSRLSLRIRADQLAHWFGAFGLGSAPGGIRIDADDAAKARAALGAEGVTLSSAQLLEAYAAFANRGTAARLRPPGVDARAPALTVRLHPETFGTLSAGLEGCVRFGTCQGAAVEGVRVAGKTGTAPALDGSGVTHAWFVGYAPADRPEVALVVFLERGTGQHDAAPLAGQILKCYFAKAKP